MKREREESLKRKSMKMFTINKINNYLTPKRTLNLS
jgi:hypothetical protein